MDIVSRDDWGAAPRRSATRLARDRVSKVVVHHTTGSYRDASTVRAIQRFHQVDRNWADIGYNFLVAPDGTIYEGRGWLVQGAHARGYNSESIGIAYIGDGRLPVPDEAFKSISYLIDKALEKFGDVEVVGHNGVGSTICPGPVIDAWLQKPREAPSDAAREPEPAPECPPTPEPRKSNRPAYMDGWVARLLGKR